MLIDTHTHLYLDEFQPSHCDAVTRAIESGVEMMIFPNVDLSTIIPMRQLHNKFPQNTRMAMGLHPTEVGTNWKNDLSTIESELSTNRTNYIAIGEIGIDLYWDKTYRNEQLKALRTQFEWAVSCDLPVIIHCREGLDETLQVLDEMAEKVPVGSDGVTFLPYLCGSTMPKYNPNARGSFTGLTPEHTPAHFARSIMEAIACILKSNLDYLGVPVTEIRAMGGGAISDLWCSMKADMTGKTLVTLKNKETACLGSAILAGVGCGYFESVEKATEMIENDKVYMPKNNDYSKVYEKYMYYDNILNTRKEKEI